ncbi:hypothetical protein [Paenisporosarcina sp. TG20]|uniref:hypothetical protein n=1 Tax=Paenisporosarcina sp. TG20 TaxID=1211706 RepID=UPI0002E96F04|nr:hypothetical protein [Paenisporosarcina sp. TG20]
MENKKPQSKYAKEKGFKPSTNEFVNKTDDEFIEHQDTLDHDNFAKVERNSSNSKQEDLVGKNQRPTKKESNRNDRPIDGLQIQGADPNLGPISFDHNKRKKTNQDGD